MSNIKEDGIPESNTTRDMVLERNDKEPKNEFTVKFLPKGLTEE